MLNDPGSAMARVPAAGLGDNVQGQPKVVVKNFLHRARFGGCGVAILSGTLLSDRQPIQTGFGGRGQRFFDRSKSMKGSLCVQRHQLDDLIEIPLPHFGPLASTGWNFEQELVRGSSQRRDSAVGLYRLRVFYGVPAPVQVKSAARYAHAQGKRPERGKSVRGCLQPRANLFLLGRFERAGFRTSWPVK
jgi:hypothetical protein